MYESENVSVSVYQYGCVGVWVCLTCVYIQLSPGHGVVEGQVKQAETPKITNLFIYQARLCLAWEINKLV